MHWLPYSHCTKLLVYVHTKWFIICKLEVKWTITWAPGHEATKIFIISYMGESKKKKEILVVIINLAEVNLKQLQNAMTFGFNEYIYSILLAGTCSIQSYTALSSIKSQSDLWLQNCNFTPLVVRKFVKVSG